MSKKFNRAREVATFKAVFDLINQVLGAKAFRRQVDGKNVGSFSDAAFEALMVGVKKNLEELKKNPNLIADRTVSMWEEEAFKKYTGAGVRGTTRIVKIVPFAKTHFEV